MLLEDLKTWWTNAAWPQLRSFKQNLTASQAINLSKYGEPSWRYALEQKVLRINEMIINKASMDGETELLLKIPEMKAEFYEALKKYYNEKGYNAFYHVIEELGTKKFLVISWEESEKEKA